MDFDERVVFFGYQFIGSRIGVYFVVILGYSIYS